MTNDDVLEDWTIWQWELGEKYILLLPDDEWAGGVGTLSDIKLNICNAGQFSQSPLVIRPEGSLIL